MAVRPDTRSVFALAAENARSAASNSSTTVCGESLACPPSRQRRFGASTVARSTFSRAEVETARAPEETRAIRATDHRSQRVMRLLCREWRTGYNRRMRNLIVVCLAIGASVAAAPAPEVTFTRDVAPILHAKCVTCHRAGEVAPMPLLTFDDARPWARAIKDKVVSRQMPPWFADPAVG